jgi:SAM-dependent methyltransferase
MSTVFDIKRSQSYWRFVPSGEGKHNSAELIELPDVELERIWDRAFASRFLRYPEEECFIRQMAAEFKNKRILSIGSGMGFHEIYYQQRGARVTCCDIVETNLQVIRRICTIKGLEPIQTIISADSSRESFEGPYDVAFIYGSLMAMPAAEQRHLLTQVRKALHPDGQIVLMLYTWKFAESTCGWNSPAEFDPLIFAKASDPTTEGEHCPWSD